MVTTRSKSKRTLSDSHVEETITSDGVKATPNATGSSSKRPRTAVNSNKAALSSAAKGDSSSSSAPVSVTSTSSPAAHKSKNVSYFLIKSEPIPRYENGYNISFSIENLESIYPKSEPWTGIRNYEARNILQSMKLGDQCFFYHSNCGKPGIVGLCEVVGEPSVDETQYQEGNPYYDPKSTTDKPKWFKVDVQFVRNLRRPIGLKELQGYDELSDMQLIKRGRLSVQRVTKEQWDFILSLENAEE
ncbi:PUA-like domain-containing protein [Gaertneriomyces semiglobifer]|nr:PUA-like domain-containing protein [Gaertneriomyces semiglobifer]